jgi:hypothetical protein
MFWCLLLFTYICSNKYDIVLSLRPRTLKHEILYGCHTLCFNVIFERDIVSHVLLFVRLTVVFSSHMDVKVNNVLVQLGCDAFIYLCCANCVFKVTWYMSPERQFRWSVRIVAWAVYSWSRGLCLWRQSRSRVTPPSRYDLDKRYTAVALRPWQVYCQPYNISC